MERAAIPQPAPAPIVALRAAADAPDRVRYVDAARRVTTSEHAAAIRDIAGFVRASGVKPSEVAAIFAPNRVEWMEAALGTQLARGVMVPIYASCTSEQAGYILRHSAARIVFVDAVPLLTKIFEAWDQLGEDTRVVCLDDGIDVVAARTAAKFGPNAAEIDRRVLSWSTARAAGRDVAVDETEIQREDRAIMLYTSGTTGDPKGVPLTHTNLLSNLETWLDALAPKLAIGDRDLFWLPMSHVFGYGEACIGNMLAWESHMCRPDQVLEQLPTVKPQTFLSVPSYWEKIGAAAKEQPFDEVTGGNLRFCLSGGAGLAKPIKEQFLENGVLIIEGYGLTETSPTLTINRPEDFDFETVGKPLDNVELKLADDGEILARGPNVFGGYHNDPEATARAFGDDGWFRTGDVGVLDERGFLKIVDRKKDILVTAGGKNVAPANIELRFKDDPNIAHLVVYGDGKKYLTAGVWLTDRGSRDAVAERIEEINENLASCETIKKFLVFSEPLTVESGYLTPTLKIRRKRIYARFGPKLDELYR